MRPLKNELRASDKVLYVFYDFETTQNTRYSEKATLHVPNLLCVQQVCSKCENEEDIEQACLQCSQRKRSFWEGPVGDLLSYLCKLRPWANNIVAIGHNAEAFDLHFILSHAIMLKWQPELIMNGLKIMCMKMEHMVFLDRLSFFPSSLRKLPAAFDLTATKSWCPHYFNTQENLHYVGTNPDVPYYGVKGMSESEWREFLDWYEGQKAEAFDKTPVLESYC
jgi:hypothetical protein